MRYILDLSVDEGQTFVGVITDAVAIEKYQEFGDIYDINSLPAGVAPPPKNWKGIPAINIKLEGMFDKNKRVLFNDKESRDRMYNALKNQIYDQANSRQVKQS